MGRRTIIKSRPHSYVERDRDGRFRKWTNRGRAQKADRRVKAKTMVKPGYGHRGDQPRISSIPQASPARRKIRSLYDY